MQVDLSMRCTARTGQSVQPDLASDTHQRRVLPQSECILIFIHMTHDTDSALVQLAALPGPFIFLRGPKYSCSGW